MLHYLLNLMATGSLYTQQELAETLAVDSDLIVQMINQLVKLGYLRESEDCATGCESCALHIQCGPRQQLRSWTLTDKGLRAARDV
ncbi:MAG: MarR family transcriptional regulator [Anaerolineae bacterium]|nr:MarR family transcriptional regulator [Anaerolineae bacterium]